MSKPNSRAGDQNRAGEEIQPGEREQRPDRLQEVEDLAHERGGNIEGIADREGRRDLDEFDDIEPGDLGASTTASGIGEDDTGSGIGDTRLGAQDDESGFGEPRGRAERPAS